MRTIRLCLALMTTRELVKIEGIKFTQDEILEMNCPSSPG